MTRIIHMHHGSQERRRILRLLLCMTEKLESSKVDPEELADMAAFALIALENIQQSIDKSASAWEKRGYWVKADGLRSEWNWLEGYISALNEHFKEKRPFSTFISVLRNLNQAIKAQGVTCERAIKEKFWAGFREKVMR